MSEPSVEPSLLVEAGKWIWGLVLGLVGMIWKANERQIEAIKTAAAADKKELDEKIDYEVRCARIEIKSKADSADFKGALKHIETLFENAERDRKETRDLITALDHRAQDTMRLMSADIMKAIAEIGNGRRK